jgi:hypothetical protein
MSQKDGGEGILIALVVFGLAVAFLVMQAMF